MALTMTNKRLLAYYTAVDYITKKILRVVGIDILNDGYLFDQDMTTYLEYENRLLMYGVPSQYPNQLLFNISDKRLMDWLFKGYLMKLSEHGDLTLNAYGLNTGTNPVTQCREASMFLQICNGRIPVNINTETYRFEVTAIIETIFILDESLDSTMRNYLREFDDLLAILIATRRTNLQKMQRSGLFV